MKKKKDIPVFTHAQLVDVGVRYLNGPGKCHAVLADLNMNMGEIPDCIGWSYANHSTLIEVKVSRSDFQRDKDKIWRKVPKQGMGRWRYYMVPKGMLMTSDLDDFSVETGFVPNGWGLLEVDSAKRVRMLRKSLEFKDRHFKGEMRMMIGALRRVQLRLDGPLHKHIGAVLNAASNDYGKKEIVFNTGHLPMLTPEEEPDAFEKPFILNQVESEDEAQIPWHAHVEDTWENIDGV